MLLFIVLICINELVNSVCFFIGNEAIMSIFIAVCESLLMMVSSECHLIFKGHEAIMIHLSINAIYK